MALKWIYSEDTAANCFFRSALKPPDLKVMLQITTRCNMRCKHCFLSATGAGVDMPYSRIKSDVIHKLTESKVKKVTLTGGEPLLHPDILDIVAALHDANIQSCICTNASLITEVLLKQLKDLNVHFNVSLDGISPGSHGRFREISYPSSFIELLDNIQMIGHYNMLNGILTTPNKLTRIEEYTAICDFAIQAGAKYLLLNPLSPFGRGKDAVNLTLSPNEMGEIKNKLNEHFYSLPPNESFRIVYIRFPNCDGKVNAPCAAGLIPYIFSNGDIAICPYMVFAADNPDNNYSSSDFIVGNVFEDGSIAEKIRAYQGTHCFCHHGKIANLGCAAMKIAKNISLDNEDVL